MSEVDDNEEDKEDYEHHLALSNYRFTGNHWKVRHEF